MRPSGFTLIDLLIAIVLFSLISMAAYKLLSSASTAQKAIDSIFKRLDHIQRAELIIEKDFSQVIDLSLIEKLDKDKGAFRSPYEKQILVTFLRTGWRNPLQELRSDLQRVAYALEDSALIRYYWPVVRENNKIDTNEIKTHRQLLLENVSEVKFRYLDNKNKWHKVWPPKLKQNTSNFSLNLSEDQKAKESTAIPFAVEFTIIHQYYGSVVILVPLVANHNLTDTKKESSKTSNNITNESFNFHQL